MKSLVQQMQEKREENKRFREVVMRLLQTSNQQLQIVNDVGDIHASVQT